MMTPEYFKLVMTQVMKFNTLATANQFAAGCIKPHFVLLGDDGLFWVTSGRWASKLAKEGYQYA